MSAASLLVLNCYPFPNTCSRYDIDIVALSWAFDGASEDGIPEFKHVSRYMPQRIFIEGAYLAGDIACFGSAAEWFFWDWRENTVARVILSGTPVSTFPA